MTPHPPGDSPSPYTTPSRSDGPISSVLNVTDDAGNTASATGAAIDLDTSADLDGALTLSRTDTPMNNGDNDAAASTVKVLDGDATPVVTFSDGTTDNTVNVS